MVRGARDAGVYVGQSRNIIVRAQSVPSSTSPASRSRTRPTPTCYDNIATDNAGGILVFNLPGPPVQDGRRTRVLQQPDLREQHAELRRPRHSRSRACRPAPGSMVLANDEVEFFGNTFRDNDTTHIILISYNTAELFGAGAAQQPGLRSVLGDGVHPRQHLHRRRHAPAGRSLDAAGRPATAACRCPTSSIDGDVNPAKLVDGPLPDGLRPCVQQPGATFVNLDIAERIRERHQRSRAR